MHAKKGANEQIAETQNSRVPTRYRADNTGSRREKSPQSEVGDPLLVWDEDGLHGHRQDRWNTGSSWRREMSAGIHTSTEAHQA